MHTSPATHDLVLVGAGHTNMHVVRMFRMHPIPGVRLTLISSFGDATYSGMLPGTLAGLYTPDDMTIDLYRAVEPSGMRLIVARAVGLDSSARRVHLEGRPPVRFDVCSVGIGSVPARRDLWEGRQDVLSIKPMPTFLGRLESALERVAARDSLRLAVVGGGAAGTEVAFCVERYLVARGLNPTVTLVDGGSEILSGYLPRTRRLAMAECQRRGIELLTNARVTSIGDDELICDDGRTHAADLIIWAAAAAPPPVLSDFDLPKAEDGFLAVRPTLQTTSGAPVFVVGDTASFSEMKVARAGVYAVREGPVLWENIGRLLKQQPLREYRPQSGFLSLLATGDGRAIGQYKGLAVHGRWVWKLKDRIDRRFMQMHQMYGPVMLPTPAPATAAPLMKCRGCGGKVGAGVLAAALQRLDVGDSTHAGLGEPDDAAILDISHGPANVVSVDFFQAFLSDPWLVGRVAALNSLSDIWAMGADPVGALAMVSLPEAAPGLQTDLLYQLLAGGQFELSRAGASLLGGHTIEAQDLTIGYTMLGRFSDGASPFRKGDLQPGQLLVLTKPLGTGTLLAALGDGACRAKWMRSLLPQMLVSNQAASKIARDFSVSAATDVTGFGFAGHLLEMLNAGDVGAELFADRIPLYEGFAELTEAGVRSTLYPANREAALASGLRLERTESVVTHALFDPQTSGGLLIAISEEQADAMVAALQSAGCSYASVVARVTAGGGEFRFRC